MKISTLIYNFHILGHQKKEKKNNKKRSNLSTIRDLKISIRWIWGEIFVREWWTSSCTKYHKWNRILMNPIHTHIFRISPHNISWRKTTTRKNLIQIHTLLHMLHVKVQIEDEKHRKLHKKNKKIPPKKSSKKN